MAGFTYCNKSGRRCAICGGQTGDCRVSPERLHFCHTHKEQTFVPGYVYLKTTEDDVWGLWIHEDDLDRDRERPRVHRPNFRRAASTPPPTVSAPPPDDPSARF